MRPGEKFSDERVRLIKRLLARGSDPVAIARIERVNANTIRRILRGESYNAVSEPEFDAWIAQRRPVDLGYDPAQGVAHVSVSEGMSPHVNLPEPDLDADAMLESLMDVQKESKGG